MLRVYRPVGPGFIGHLIKGKKYLGMAYTAAGSSFILNRFP
jgi:hypothetical protein